MNMAETNLFASPAPGDPLIAWNPERFTVGVERIDAEHRLLVDLLNRIHGSASSAEGLSAARVVLEELQHHAMLHFRTEEELMRRHGYPLTQTHIAEHHCLTMRAEQLLESSLQGNVSAARETLLLLRDWLSTHILKIDVDLGRHLNTCGVY